MQRTGGVVPYSGPMALNDPVVKVSVPGVRIDVITVLAAGLSAIVVIGTLKVLAIRHKDHPVAQGFNVLF